MALAKQRKPRRAAFLDNIWSLKEMRDDIYYLYDKILVENILSQANINSTILRFPFVYGQGDYSRVFPYLKNMLDKDHEIILDKDKAKWASTRGHA